MITKVLELLVKTGCSEKDIEKINLAFDRFKSKKSQKLKKKT